jgi:hypothetical protein
MMQPLCVIAKRSIKGLENMEMERISDMAFCALKEKIYQKAFSWDELSEYTGELECTFPNRFEKKYFCRYSFRRVGFNFKKDTKKALVIEVLMHLIAESKTHFSCTRTLYLERHAL